MTAVAFLFVVAAGGAAKLELELVILAADEPDVVVALEDVLPLVPVVLAELLIGTVVALSIMTIVVPSMTVVLPEIERFGFTGTVVGELKMSRVVPSTTVKEPGRPVGFEPGTGTVAPFGKSRNGIPLIVLVIAPEIPVGTSESGIEVPDGNIK